MGKPRHRAYGAEEPPGLRPSSNPTEGDGEAQTRTLAEIPGVKAMLAKRRPLPTSGPGHPPAHSAEARPGSGVDACPGPVVVTPDASWWQCIA